MKRASSGGLAILLAASTLGAQPQDGQTTTRTWTGWFSDKLCARVRDDAPRPNGTACVKKCLDGGATAVFISEQAKAVFDVRDHPTVKDDVGYYLQVTGIVDSEARTISVQSVKRLSEVTAMCAIRTKGEKKK
jgi:hypothetical protein